MIKSLNRFNTRFIDKTHAHNHGLEASVDVGLASELPGCPNAAVILDAVCRLLRSNRISLKLWALWTTQVGQYSLNKTYHSLAPLTALMEDPNWPPVILSRTLRCQYQNAACHMVASLCNNVSGASHNRPSPNNALPKISHAKIDDVPGGGVVVGRIGDLNVPATKVLLSRCTSGATSLAAALTFVRPSVRLLVICAVRFLGRLCACNLTHERQPRRLLSSSQWRSRIRGVLGAGWRGAWRPLGAW